MEDKNDTGALQQLQQPPGDTMVQWGDLTNMMDEITKNVNEQVQLKFDSLQAQIDRLTEEVNAVKESGAEEVLVMPARGSIHSGLGGGGGGPSSVVKVASGGGGDKESTKKSTKKSFKQTLANQGNLGSDDVTVDAWGFRGTCWDAAAFAFHETMTCPESLDVMFLCLLCATVQGLFILIVFMSLTGSNVSDEDIDGFHMWRTSVGQHGNFVDPLTEESLASRVCRVDTALHLSDRQVVYVKDINDYLFENSPFNGPMMCCLALLTWSLTCFQEFYALREMWFALFTLPTGRTLIEYQKKKGKIYMFHPGRLAWIAFLSLVRFTIADTLLIAGYLFLVVTLSIEDILLNAVALEFVLHVDELIYKGMAPMKTRSLLLTLKPIALPKHWQFVGLDTNSVVSFFFCFGLLGVMAVMYLIPEMDQMKKAKTELCGGEKMFGYARAGWGLTLWKADTANWEEKREIFKGTMQYRVARDVIRFGAGDTSPNFMDARLPPEPNPGPNQQDPYLANLRAPAMVGPGWTIVNFPNMDMEAFATYQQGCADLLTNLTRYADPAYWDQLGAVRDAVGDQTFAFCSDIKQYCNDVDTRGTSVRFACAQTCGCDSPAGTLTYFDPYWGCPGSCAANGALGIAQRMARTCTQTPRATLIADPVWQSMMPAMINASALYSVGFSGYYRGYAANVITYGCDFITLPAMTQRIGFDPNNPYSWLGAGNACNDVDFFKNIAFWCPTACGCTRKKEFRSKMCPVACPEDGSIIPAGTQTPAVFTDRATMLGR